MDIRYYSYTEEIIDDIKPGTVHIFDKNTDKQSARKKYKGDIFDEQPLLMTTGEFKGNLFLSDRISLKEEKQVIAFYKALSSEHRKRLKVEGYYDVIDIAANFFNFFRMLNEYRISEITSLKEWQRGIYDLFVDIRKNYLKLLDERNYTDSVFIGSEENFEGSVYDRYKGQEIVIYNKLYFTPREKWIIERLEEAGHKFVLKLQLNREDFSETDLQLKNVTYEKSGGVRVFRTADEFTSLMKILEITTALDREKKHYSIYDANNDNFKYNNFFNEVVYLSEIPIFKLIECIHIMVAGLETQGYVDIKSHDTREILRGRLLINMKNLVEVVEIEEFRRYYKLDERDIELIKFLVEEGYKFITRAEIERLIKRLEEDEKRRTFEREDFIGILHIAEDLADMYLMTSLKKWCEKLTFTREVMKEFSTSDGQEINKYFEALSEVEIIEELDLIETGEDGEKSWDTFFGDNISEGLLRLIMKYHRFKEVAGSGHKLKKEPLEDLPTTHGTTRIFMNIADIFVPENKGSSFLLTEAQRKEAGIKNADDDRLLEKYNLLRGVMTAKDSYIITVENQGSNVSLSPFIEEIIEEDSEDTTVGMDTENYLEIVKEIMEQRRPEDIENHEDTELALDKEELLLKKNMSAYMCDELFGCRYKMYLRYIMRLDRETLEVDEGLTRREYGNLAHDIFEEVLMKYIKEPGRYDSLQGHDIDTGKIYEIVERLTSQPGRKLKLPHLNSKYYKEIIYKNLAEGVRRFFREISKELKGQKVVDIHVEEYGYKEIDRGIYQSAKGDLIIDTETDRYIIDFKTGNKVDRQLDYYGILYTGRADGARKYIYNIDKNELAQAEKVVMTKEDLVEEVNTLLDSKTYERNYTSKCKRCDYWVVCKEVEKNV